MHRPVWTGHISFGLIQIPVRLYSAEHRPDIQLRMLDSRNQARVRYERVNEITGEEVPWSEIVKAYELDEDNYVVLDEDELTEIKPEATKTLDIESFVDEKEIDCFFLFDKPYYLEPNKQSRKSYSLLREVLNQTKKIGICRVVIRTRQYLAVIMVRGNALVANLIRFPQEVRKIDEFDIPKESLKTLKVSKKDLEMSKSLVEAMSTTWKPGDYVDDYRMELLKYVEKKKKQKKTSKKKRPQEKEASPDNVVDISELLKKSLQKAKAKSSSRKTG